MRARSKTKMEHGTTDRYVVWWGYGCEDDGCVWFKQWLISREHDTAADTYAAGSYEACRAAVRLFSLD